MPVETEYTRTYVPFTSSPPPNPPVGTSVPAGLSSAKLGKTQEPPVGMKRKETFHERKVTFTTDYTENGSPTKQDNKGLKFKAGYRRLDTKTPTEYQRQYSWPETPPSETPLLNSQHMLHSSTSPPAAANIKHYTTPQDGNLDIASNGHSDRQNENRRTDPDVDMSSPVPVESAMATNGHAKAGQKSHSDSKASKKRKDEQDRLQTRLHKQHIHGQRQRQFIQDLMTKQPGKKGQSAKKAHKKLIKQFVTEYQRQYGKWSVVAEKKKKKTSDKDQTGPAGVPRVLTDSTDPRLLKHSPLPPTCETRPHPPQTREGWVSNYRANFVSPTDVEFVEGAWRGTHHGKSTVEVSPTEHAQEDESEQPIPSSHSWYNQLVELRERAEVYKKRAEGVNIGRLLPLTRHNTNSDTPSVTGTSFDSNSCTPSSPTPSDSVSCTYSDVPDPPKQTRLNGHLQPHFTTRSNKVPQATGNGVSMPVHNIEDLSSHDDPTDHARAKKSINSEQPSSVHPGTSDDGRIQTPVIQKTVSGYKRHHLDRTTPVAGGLFISPKKPGPVSMSIPFPSVSPKYRRDMKSTAPISPAPKQTRDEYIQVDSETMESSRSSLTPPHKERHHVPATSSPYHTHCAPTDTAKTKLSSSRKLDFASQKSSQSRVSVPKTLYSHRVQGNTNAHKDNCAVCGANLKPTPTHFTASTSMKNPSSKLHSSQNGLGSHLTNGSLGGTQAPRSFTTHTAAVPSSSQRPMSSTNYMTRLPLYGEGRSRDFDETSISSLSLSSCSVASDVLRKARNRRDNFWSQPHVTAK